MSAFVTFLAVLGGVGLFLALMTLAPRLTTWGERRRTTALGLWAEQQIRAIEYQTLHELLRSSVRTHPPLREDRIDPPDATS